MSTNTHEIFYNSDKTRAIIEYRHGRSDYEARARVTFYRGLDGGVSVENMMPGDEAAVIPADLLVEVMQSIGALPAAMAGRE